MKSLYKLGVALTLAAALVGCKSDREKLVESRFDFQKTYDEQTEQSVKNFAVLRENVPESKIREVIKKHRSFEQGRQDILDLYSEKNFTDAEFTQIMDARQRIMAGQQPSAEQKPAMEKLVELMQARYEDASYKEQGKVLFDAVLADLDK
ncbi:MAG: hypothetical protein ACN6QH_18120 [Pseudomonas sp.]|uniref:hypothetical protein n=1 Tax=Pseudomonas sp. TaxID=306 RepID=UPI003D149F5C